MMKKYRGHVLVGIWLIGGALMIAGAQEDRPTAFSRTTIDLGVVVSDVQKAVTFYTEVLGFTKVSEFDVAAQMAADTGLTDHKPFKVQVLALGKDPSATKLKVMEIPGAGSKAVDNQYISSSLGFRYLTVFVADLNGTMKRLEQHGVAPVKAPYQLGGANSYLILVKDPDGNIIELIGPRS
jgi:catechol 2,3-dioxygenase-like lactoylglutathione lyase family enzyme